jgi:hypothetical protein
MNTFEDTPIETTKLKNLLKEEVVMAKFDPKAVAQQRAAGENTTEENNAMMDSLLNEAKEETARQQETQGATDEFSKDIEASTAAEEARKEREKAERNAKIKENNDFVDSSINEIVSKGAGEFTAAMKLYRTYCQKYMRVEGLIFENGPKAKIGVSSSYQKNKDGSFVIDETTNPSQADRDALAKGKSVTKEQKDKYGKKTAKISYGMSAPRNLIGAVIKTREKLQVPQSILTQPNFVAPTPDEVSASAEVHIPVSYDAFFYNAFVCCDARIQEARELFNANPYYKKNSTNGEIEAFVKLTRSRKTGDTFSGTKAKSSFRFPVRGLAIQENTIPVKTYEFKNADNLTESETQLIKTKLETLLTNVDAGKNVQRYELLDPDTKKTITKDAAGNIDLSFVKDAAKISSLGLKAIDWGKKNYDTAKPSAIELTGHPMPVYQLVPAAKEGAKDRIVDVAHELGKDGYSLDDLNTAGFTAAGHAKANGITEESILKVYKRYRDGIAAKRTSTSATLKKKSTNIDSEDIQKAFLDSTVANAKGNLLAQTTNFGALEKELNELSI